MNEPWPALPYDSWKDTYFTLHRWSQIVGKIQLGLTPVVNHFWNVALQVTATGFGTPPIPWKSSAFQIDFDFLEHRLVVDTCDGETRTLPLVPRSVADFHRELLGILASLGVRVAINPKPQEIKEEALPLDEDRIHASYDPDKAWRWWRILLSSQAVFEEYRARFLGKSSPIQFYWGSFDLAVTRFSGRRAPIPPGAGPITREGHSHEAISAGLWPGTAELGGPAFYGYTAPPPPGLETAAIRPAAAGWDKGFAEFLLPYEAVRTSGDPRATLLEFLQSTYEAGADLAGWKRTELERMTAPG